MAGLFGVMLVTVHAEVLDEKTILQGEIGVPYFCEAVVNHSRWFLVDKWNLAIRQKISNLPLNAGFVLRPAA
ncbi:MAG: hypothetical protein PHR77_12390 [Kiritimatiellae bacterium]|nr:hypothetical protein [Kiritimatiellia bacterium]MDD5519509.1 hypothetical protein [Kiritimatiellia bacterium]